MSGDVPEDCQDLLDKYLEDTEDWEKAEREHDESHDKHEEADIDEALADLECLPCVFALETPPAAAACFAYCAVNAGNAHRKNDDARDKDQRDYDRADRARNNRDDAWERLCKCIADHS